MKPLDDEAPERNGIKWYAYEARLTNALCLLTNYSLLVLSGKFLFPLQNNFVGNYTLLEDSQVYFSLNHLG